jgi:glycosyltransferase involved in cell wall biosynthesis
MKKKVLFFLSSLSGGGAERTVVNIINNLDREKFELLLVLGSKKNNDYIDFVDKNITIKYLNHSRVRYCLYDLIKVIKEEQPSLLFTTLIHNNIIVSLARVLSLRKIPVIVREANNRIQSGKVSRINKLSTFLTYNYLAKKVIALSNGVKEDLVNNFKVNKDKIEVIYNPIEVGKIKQLSNEKIDDLKFNNDEMTIIAVGRLVEQKDYPTLLKAFSIVTKSVKSRLVILGKGPLENELKQLTKKLNISNKVIFLGFKENPYKYMKKADIFVLSSKWEGFGHVIVEAMVCGTSVISTDCKSGPGEIIGDDKYGILTPVGDHDALAENIINLLMDDEKRNKLCEKGLKRAEEFDAKTIVKRYETVFEKVLK